MFNESRSQKAKAMRIEQEIRRDNIAGLYLQGWPIRRICRELHHSERTVVADLREIKQRLMESSRDKLEERQAVELAKITAVEAKAWEQYLRSCEDGYKLVEETTPVEDDGSEKAEKELAEATTNATKVTKRRKEVQGQTGDPRYLTIINQCIERRCKILGLDAPEKFQDVTPANTVEILVATREESRTVMEFISDQNSIKN